jgi:hypothetical protein
MLRSIPHCCLVYLVQVISYLLCPIILSNRIRILGLVVFYITNYHNPNKASPSTLSKFSLPLTILSMVSIFYFLLKDKFLIFTHPDADYCNLFIINYLYSDLHVLSIYLTYNLDQDKIHPQ